MYALLFLGLPVVGVWLYLHLCSRMAAEGLGSRPVFSLFAVFAAYGAVLLFSVSAAFGVWSGMHSIAFVGLVVIGVPWLLVQGVRLRRRRGLSAYHRAVFALSLAFPLVFGALAGLTVLLG